MAHDYNIYSHWCTPDEIEEFMKANEEKLNEILHENDEINKPKHYQLFPDMESMDAIEKLLSKEEFVGFLKGNMLKYRYRAGKKDDALKDIAKADRYETILMEYLKNNG